MENAGQWGKHGCDDHSSIQAAARHSMCGSLRRLGAALAVIVIGMASAPVWAVVECGNGIVEPGEECDGGDGNPLTIDTYLNGSPPLGQCTSGGECFFKFSCCKFNCQRVGQGPACDDNNDCSAADHCQNIGADNVVCRGEVVADGTACDDHTQCSPQSACSAGQCVGISNCDACQVCDPLNGCQGPICTATPTPTATATPTETPTYTATPTATPTSTATPTATPTVTPTPTPQCIGRPDGFGCDDGLFCNGADVCHLQSCSQHAGDPCRDGAECSATCNEAADNCFDLASTPCSADDRVCTLDVCDGAGHCSHPDADLSECPRGYAVLRWPEPAPRPVTAYLGWQSDTSGRVCSDVLRFRGWSGVTADAVALSSAASAMRFVHDNFITGAAVTGGSAVAGPQHVIAGSVDTSGSAPQLGACRSASALVSTRRDSVALMPATQTFAAPIVIPRGGSLMLSTTGGTEVIDVPALNVRPRATLQIQGVAESTDELFVVRVHGAMYVRYRARIELVDLEPQQVLFIVDGVTRLAQYTQLSGTFAGAESIRLGRFAVLNGQLVGQDEIRVGAFVALSPSGWIGW